MADARWLFVAAVAALATVACKGEGGEPSSKPKRPSSSVTVAAPSAVVSTATAPTDPSEPRPRYLRVNGQGVLVDATRFPSVPESIVEKEVKDASTRRDAARLLHRFGVNPNLDRGGEVSFIKASLVDGLERERLLVVSLIGEVDEQGMRDEDDFIVFLATTSDDRLIGLGSDVVSARTHESKPIALALQELHTADADDVVATWSACTPSTTTGCHGMRAWTMLRGFPERIVDVVGDSDVTIDSGPTPPHDVTTGPVVLKFDPLKYAYR